MQQLSNKVAIITGASSGIGYATSRLFAREGAKVVVAARRQAELDALVGEIEESGGKAVALAGRRQGREIRECLGRNGDRSLRRS